jgi:signal transduction histidine kinase
MDDDAATEDLRASRRRLVSAADADRRAFERELHDGLQQQLVALSIDLRNLARLIDADPVAAHALLDEMTANVRTAMADATTLAGRIYPPLLAERGLATSIRAAAEGFGITIVIDAPASAGYPPEIATTIYWTCVETLSFASPGSEATVRVVDTEDALTFDVGIDGRPPEALLTRLRDRVEALDGGVAIDDQAGGGSLVHGWVPWSP